MTDAEMRDFMNNKVDFGTLPADFQLTEDQKKLSVLAMAVNAAIVQFIGEGLFPPDQQLHFMGHLQDFANRLYNGESIKMPLTSQTLQINSKAGTLFYEATGVALKDGSANFQKIKEISQEFADKLAQQDNSTSKNTLH